MHKYRDIIHEALKINILTLAVFAFLYVFFNNAFSFFSTGKDEAWLLSKYVTLKNNGRAPVYDDNILICSIAGVSSRDSIATIIEKLESFGPRAVGCDIIFSNTGAVDTRDNEHLRQAIEGHDNIITAQRPVLDGLGRLSTIEKSFFGKSIRGDVTVYPDGSHSRVTSIDGREFVNFASLVAETAYPGIGYPSGEYAVNYTNRHFPVMGIDELAPEDVNGKVVLVGDPEDLRDYIDMDFAVTDHRYPSTLTTSRRISGVFLHAYAISSIANDDWIIMVPKWISLLFGFTASFFLCLLGKFWSMRGIPRCYFKCVHLVVFTLMIWISYPLYLAFDMIISPLFFTIGVAMSDFSSAVLDMARHTKDYLKKRKKHA